MRGPKGLGRGEGSSELGVLDPRSNRRKDEGEGDILNLGRVKMLPRSQVAGDATPGDQAHPLCPRPSFLVESGPVAGSACPAAGVVNLPPTTLVPLSGLHDPSQTYKMTD